MLPRTAIARRKSRQLRLPPFANEWASTYFCPEAIIKADELARQKNRRRSRRGIARSNLRLECRKGSYGLGPNLTSKVLDVSDTGARIVVTQPIDVLGEVEIIVNGYGMKGMIKRLGNIRWQVKLETGEYCVGVEFQKCLPYRDWQNLVAPT